LIGEKKDKKNRWIRNFMLQFVRKQSNKGKERANGRKRMRQKEGKGEEEGSKERGGRNRRPRWKKG
jgi:hypothetical protein